MVDIIQHRHVVLGLLILMLVALFVVPPSSITAQDSESQDPHITLEISNIQYLRDVHSSDDWTDEAEGRLWIVSERTCKGRQATIVLPTDDVVKLLPGQETSIFAGTSLGACINDSTDRVFYHLILFDEDQWGSAAMATLSQGMAWISTQLEQRAMALRALERGSPAYWGLLATSLVLQNPWVQDKIISYFTSSDVMGEVTLDLARSEEWQADGKPHTVESTNGAVRFTYVVRVAESLGHPKAPSSLKGMLRRTDGAVNLRAGPGKQYRKITVLRNNIVELTGLMDNGWFEIIAGSDRGWVFGELLRNP